MGGDAPDVGLEETQQGLPNERLADTRDAGAATPALAQTVAATVRAIGTEDTAATPRTPVRSSASASTGQSTARRAAANRARALFVAVATFATVQLVAFIVRFVISADRPQLHPKYQGETRGGPFQAMALFDGPLLTLIEMTVVATVYLGIAIWISRRNRREVVPQLLAALAALAGQLSITVAVLTSSETLIAWRVLAMIIYVVVPAAALSTIAMFPNGKPVPRWSLWCIPPALVPFAIQAVIMFQRRDFSVRAASTFFPIMVVFLAFQWHRYRKHASLKERHQIKWLSYAGVAFATLQAIAVVVFIPLLDHRDSPAFPFVRVVFELLLASSYLVGLSCLLFSAARYRLWDIDRVINRTIVYGVVTVLLGAICGVGYFALRALLSSFFDASALVSGGIALALMFALFAPTRRRIGRWIDRRFYGIGLDYEALAAKAVRAARTTLPTTSTALGAYDELVLLGRGGMGAVYRAHHADFGVPVALKVMSPALADDAGAQARFRRESQILEDLQHPNVIPFLAAGHEAGLAFIAMQYVEGEDLGAVVRRRGSLPLEEAAPLVAGIAAALDVAHQRGVVHRDIKPANVFVEGTAAQPLENRRPMVMDFGVARLAGDSSAADPSMVGSLPYIAPEQIHNGDQVDGRADVYALAATAYELVTGRPPFVEATALGLVLAHLHQPPTDPRMFTRSLTHEAAAAILKGLAKEPSARYATAGEFAAALCA